jgi:hypothetical protein
MVTADAIIDWLKKSVAAKHPVSASQWLDAALKLTVLIGDENSKLFSLEQKVAEAKVACIDAQEKKSVALADVMVRTLPVWLEYRTQEAKVEQIQELVRVAKKQAELSSWEEKIQR